MRQPKYSVTLTKDEVEALRNFIDYPDTPKTRKARAEILLDLNGKSKPYAVIEEFKAIYGVTKPLIYRLMKKFGEVGVEAVKKSPNPVARRPHRMIPQVKKIILSWIKTPTPQGKKKWSAYTIVDKLKEEGHTNKISHQTIYRFLDRKGIKQ